MELLMEIVNVGVYSVLGIVLMILGNFLIDLIVPAISLRRSKREIRRWDG